MTLLFTILTKNSLFRSYSTFAYLLLAHIHNINMQMYITSARAHELSGCVRADAYLHHTYYYTPWPWPWPWPCTVYDSWKACNIESGTPYYASCLAAASYIITLYCLVCSYNFLCLWYYYYTVSLLFSLLPHVYSLINQGKLCCPSLLNVWYNSHFILVCSPNTCACKDVFNPNIPIFQPNCAKGSHFSAFHLMLWYISCMHTVYI